MSLLPRYFDSGDFARSLVQEMLDEAQIHAGSRFARIPYLRDQLQEHLLGAIEQCNHLEVDPMEMLHGAMFFEQAILDAYNKHRLGKAVTQFNPRVPEPENAVEYRMEENIPDTLAWFPVRAAVSRCGMLIQAPPIYQVDELAETNQQHVLSQNVPLEAPAQIKDTRKVEDAIGIEPPQYIRLQDVSVVHRGQQDDAALARHMSTMKASHTSLTSTPQCDSDSLPMQVGVSIDIDDDIETARCEFDEDMDDTIVVFVKDNRRESIVALEETAVRESDEDNDTIVVCVKDNKRRNIIVPDEADEGFATSKSPKRHQKDAPSRSRKATLPDGISPESNSNAYVEPKRSKPAGAATRSSSRSCKFTGSYV